MLGDLRPAGQLLAQRTGGVDRLGGLGLVLQQRLGWRVGLVGVVGVGRGRGCVDQAQRGAAGC